MFLLDTNVVSEATKVRPNPLVLAWSSRSAQNAFISVMTVGEITKGIQRLPTGPRRSNLDRWLRVLGSKEFRARILPVTEIIAAEWGRLLVATRRTLPCADSLLAATARVHDLTIATRNERDFADLGVRVINPWTS